MLDKYFALAANRTNVRTECLAGFTTFLTMSAILFVNPDILAAAGMRGRGQ
jgi:AGZA family xanthine/uracil permease-like MFS transporter